MSGLLVAAITTTSFMLSKPSISVRIWFTTLSVACESLLAPLFGARLSISSKKIIEGEFCLAFWNIFLTAFSDSPTHFEINSGPLIQIKLALLSVATALANKVLPVPGGPYNKIPFGGLIPILVNLSGCFNGHSTASINSCLTSSKPPISVHGTFGISTDTSLIALGLTTLSAS